MIRAIEAAIFLAFAGALHLAALSLGDLGGPSGGGDAGGETVTLEAAPERLAALARQWDRPPETAQAPMSLPPPDAAPQPAMRTAPQSPSRLTPAPPARPKAPAAPLPDTAIDTPPSPPPPPKRQDRAETEADSAQRRAPDLSQRPAARPAETAPRPDPAPRAQPQPSAPRASQRASGSGEGAGAARKPAAPPQTARGPSDAELRAAQAAWGGEIRQSVARAQRYPRGTSARGTVTLRISVTPAGSLSGARVTGSSGHAVLDRAALQAARSARLPRAPRALTAASYSFNLPLRFERR